MADFTRSSIQALPTFDPFGGRKLGGEPECDDWSEPGWDIVTEDDPPQKLAGYYLQQSKQHYRCFVDDIALSMIPDVVRIADLIHQSELEREFNERADRWEKESAIHSSPTATYLYRDYIAIIGLGISHPEVIVPLILRRIPDSGSDWFFALETIAGENPARDSEEFDEAYQLWRKWSSSKGHQFVLG